MRLKKMATTEKEIKTNDKDDELLRAVSNWKQARQDQEKLVISEIRELTKQFKKTVDHTKREEQRLDEQQKKPTGRTRSGRGRIPPRPIYTDGKSVNKGIDDADDTYDQDERDYLKKAITKMQNVSDLKFDHMKYLIMYEFLDELKDIKNGKLKSDFHDRYLKCVARGESKEELQSEIRTSLFNNEQRDYISGLLQGAFQTTIKDANDDIKHSEINYVVIVMFYECIARIVKYVHNLDNVQEALKFMRKRSREASGIDDDDDDDEED